MVNYTEHLKSDYWKQVKDAVKQRAGFKCQVCSSTVNLHVHHNSYAHLGSELDFLCDVVCLCSRCHNQFHQVENGHATVMPSTNGKTPKKKNRKPYAGETCADRIEHLISRIPLFKGKIVMTKRLMPSILNGGTFTKRTCDALGLNYGQLNRHYIASIFGKAFDPNAIRDAIAGSRVKRKRIEKVIAVVETGSYARHLQRYFPDITLNER